ncbi:MAG: TFIIB-type zinc ribbon-containing protein, partial [Acidobacteriota bacterium]
VENQLLSIARSQVESSVDRYDRGVRWERERLEVHGTRWVAMYLPVWLYSYYHEEGGKGMVHYIAVNGRTGEVMGSVPVSHPRLLAAALAVGGILEILAIAILVAAG